MSSKKVIYLDQNKWIDIAKAVLNKPNSEMYTDVKDKILKKVSDGEWIFPLSIIHHFETMSRMDDRSRQELSKVMGEISCNYSILPFMYVDKEEFINSLQKAKGLSIVDFKNEVICKDFARAVGLDGKNIEISGVTNPQQLEMIKEAATKIMENSNMFFEFMKLQSDSQFVTQLSNDNDVYIKEYEKLRALYILKPKQHRYAIYIYNNYMDRFKTDLEKFLLEAKNSGISKEEVLPKNTFENKEKTIEFLESIPSFAVMMRLSYDIINNTTRNFDKNDYKDISFLATAVPYCDVVITEKLWVSLIKSNKLDQKHNTFVTSNLNDLLNL